MNIIKKKDLKFVIGGDSQNPVAIGYGAFIQTVLEFLIISAAVFLIVKVMNHIKKKEEPTASKPAPLTTQEVLLTEIRDALKHNNKQ